MPNTNRLDTPTPAATLSFDVPFNRYLLTIEAVGFARTDKEIVVTSNLVQQLDVKLSVNPVSASVNVTLRLRQLHKLSHLRLAPITGGLFLGEALDLLARSGERINIEEDQRNTAVFEARYDERRSPLWLAFGGRHDSGYSIELEPDASEAEFSQEFSEKILEQVNLERGFVKPHTVLNLSVGREFKINEHIWTHWPIQYRKSNRQVSSDNFRKRFLRNDCWAATFL